MPTHLRTEDFSTYPVGALTGWTHVGSGSSAVASSRLAVGSLSSGQFGGDTLDHVAAALALRARAKLSLNNKRSGFTERAGGLLLKFSNGVGAAGYTGFKATFTYNVDSHAVGIAVLGATAAAQLVNTSGSAALAGALAGDLVVEMDYVPAGGSNGTLRARWWRDGDSVPSWLFTQAVSSTFATLAGPGGIYDNAASVGSNTKYASLELEGDWTEVPDTPTVTVAADLVTAQITGSAYNSTESSAHAATQARVRRVSDDAVLFGPATLGAVVTTLATGLRAARSPAEEVDSEMVADLRYQDAGGRWSAWGTSAEFTTIPLWSSGRGIPHIDVQIERPASGGGTVMQSYRDFAGRYWIRSWKLEPAGVDRGIGSGLVTLMRETGGDSLAPLMTLSDLNRVDGTYQPALDFGREVLVRGCIMPPGEEPSESDWVPLFGGITDDISWPKKVGDVSVPFRDYSGALADTIIRDESRYGDPDTPPDALVVMQQVLDDWMGSGQYTIWDLTTGGGFAVTSAIYVDISVYEAISDLALKWGGKRLEQEWNPVAEEWQLAVKDPDRAKTTPDYSVGPETYLDVDEVSTNGKDLRPIVRGECVERATGKLLTSQLPADADIPTDPLVLQYGPRALIFREPSDSSPVDSQPELDDEVAAAYADVTSVPIPLDLQTKFHPFVAVDDLIRWGANARTWDEDQDGAVQVFSHEGTGPGIARTHHTCSDRPKGAVAAWLRKGVDIAGRNARPAIRSLGLAQVGDQLVVTPDVNRQGEYMEVFSRLGSTPLDSGIPGDGTSRGRLKLREQAALSWPVRDGTHHVVGRLYAGEDQRVFAEREETIVITGVGGDGTPGSEAPTVVPGTPRIIADGTIIGSTREVNSAWENTSDTLNMDGEWIVGGVPQGAFALPPGTENVTGGPFTIGSRITFRVRYNQGASYPGDWATSHAVRVGDLV